MSQCCPDLPDCSGCQAAAGMADADAVAAIGAGRSCPASYGYGPHVFRREPDIVAETLYVVGGLYGNRYALDEIETMAMLEARHRPVPKLVFNGDFHWFDIAPPVFGEIQRRVTAHVALRGNVETELAAHDSDAGCGCAYPDDVSDADVANSNEILRRLRSVAHRYPVAIAELAGLPMHAVASVGHARIGIVHGDADTLAGWRFDAHQLRRDSAQAELAATFRAAGVDVFASSHTCLPAMHQLLVDGRHRVVINNGAAGMPNFQRSRHGVISRIATTPAPTDFAMLNEVALDVGGTRTYIAALAVCYDDSTWRAQFEQDWPAGSPAHDSYWRRIKNGPMYRIEDAYPADGASRAGSR